MTPFDQMFVLLFASIFFSIVYEIWDDPDHVWSGIIGSMCWIVFGLAWFVLATETYIIGLLWNGIGIFYIVRWMIDLVDMRSLGGRTSLGED